MRKLDRVGVIGFGKMGGGIAHVVARSDRDVIVLDTSKDRLEAGRRRVEEFLSESVRRRKITDDEKQQVLSRIVGTTEIGDLSEVDLVIEAIIEERAAKLAMFSELARVVGTETILTTNTSALSVTDIASSVTNPRRFAGLHWFNPPALMPLIEVVRALQTDREVIEELLRFCEEIGKTPVEAPDRPGFLVNKLLMPYLNDVIQAYDDGLASAADIDTALELGLGYKMGPFQLLDLIGLDIHRHATLNAYEQTQDPCYAPPPLLNHMVAAGYIGAESGTGFRSYGALHDAHDTDSSETI